MLCWKAAGGHHWPSVGRTRPDHPSKPSQPGFSRPGPLQKVEDMPVIFRGKLLLVLNLGRLPHERRPLPARRAHRRTRRPDQHRHLRDAHPRSPSSTGARAGPTEFTSCADWLAWRTGRMLGTARGERAGGSRARGPAADLCRDEDGQDLLHQGSGHDPGGDPRHRSDAARIRAHRFRGEARTDRARMETSVAGRRTHGGRGPPPEPRVLGRESTGTGCT